MKAVLGIIILLVVLTGCDRSTPVEQAQSKSIYYVSPNGSNQDNGRTKAQAWQTLEHALEIARSGGEIRVLPGTYNEELMEIEQAGKDEQLKIVGFGGRPVIDGERKRKIGFWFEGARDVVVENLEIRDYTDIGIGADGSKNITFRNLIVHDNGFKAQLTDWEIEGYGIDIDAVEGYLVEGNQVHNNGPNPQKFPDRLMGTGINTFGSKNGVIRKNKSYDNVGGGILVEDSIDIIVADNEVYGNDLDATRDEWWDGGIWLDGGRDVIIRGNNFHDNLGPGILISDEDDQEPSGYVLENNVSSNNYFGVYIWNFGSKKWPGKAVISKSNNDFRNNKIKDVLVHDWDYDPETLRPPD